MHITIFGAGAFGKALGKILTDNQHDVAFYDPFIYPGTSIQASLTQAEAIILCTPSSTIAELVAQLPDSTKSLPVILASKGLFSLNVFSAFTHLAILSGPAFAKDILAGKPATFTTSEQFVQQLFANQQITVELCDDIAGIMLCGSLKNIYAIGAGYHAKEPKDQDFIDQALAETKRYLADHQANPATADFACGIGDLKMTCAGLDSRNYECGSLLAQGVSISEIKAKLGTVEGLNALQIADTANYPILHDIAAKVEQAA